MVQNRQIRSPCRVIFCEQVRKLRCSVKYDFKTLKTGQFPVEEEEPTEDWVRRISAEKESAKFTRSRESKIIIFRVYLHVRFGRCDAIKSSILLGDIAKVWKLNLIFVIFFAKRKHIPAKIPIWKWNVGRNWTWKLAFTKKLQNISVILSFVMKKCFSYLKKTLSSSLEIRHLSFLWPNTFWKLYCYFNHYFLMVIQFFIYF